MTVAMPILSACGHETCILPAAVLSTHTGGFGKPAVVHFTQQIPQILEHWRSIGMTFDAVYIGYLGSEDAVSYAHEIIDTLSAEDGKVIVDPAMADHGKLYSGLTERYAMKMIELCRQADVILPNLTEAAMMTDLPFRSDPDDALLKRLMEKFPDQTMLLTGVEREPGRLGVAVLEGGEINCYFHEKLDAHYSGTGDIFASVFTGAWMQGRGVFDSAQIAAEFVLRSIRLTAQCPAHAYGVKFEPILPELMQMIQEKPERV